MEELIKRMREYIDRLPESFESRGMGDILLAMEERVETLKSVAWMENGEQLLKLLNKA